MVDHARKHLRQMVAEATERHREVQDIVNRSEQKASACSGNGCAYSIYVSAIYDVADDLGARRRCPVSPKVLRGTWVNSTGWGYYETITLSLYQGRPSVHQFAVFKSRQNGDVEDGFGGWGLVGCRVKTKEQTSAGGRIFNPGNELLILSFDRTKKIITLLDGDYLVDFVRVD